MRDVLSRSRPAPDRSRGGDEPEQQPSPMHQRLPSRPWPHVHEDQELCQLADLTRRLNDPQAAASKLFGGKR